MNVIVRNFPKAIYNQDILFKAGSPGNNELGSVNVQIIVEEMFNIYIVLQPRSIYATTVYADTMIEAVQSQLFAQLGMNIYLQANIYSYMEFKKEYDYPGIDVKNECDIAKIVTNKKIGRDTVTTGVIEFDYRDIPAFLKEAAG